MSNVRIRRPHPPVFAAECDAVSALFLASRRATLPEVREVHSDEETYAWMREIVFPRYSVWLAEVDGEIVGFAARDGAWLIHLYMKPGWTGKGIGKRLLDVIIKEAATRTQVLRLHTFARNAGARRFYERHGFVAAAFGDGANNKEGEPDVLYELTLNQHEPQARRH
jgi:GNAT superfamily N-acetyltransferase